MDSSKALTIPQDKFVSIIVSEAIRANITVPKDYALENCVKFAYLKICEEGYWDTCNSASVYESALKMVVLGLNPAKDQCYFYRMGNRLICMRSWYGSIAVAKRYDKNVNRVNYAVIYGGDEVEIDVRNGIRFVTFHKQNFANVRSDNIVGAYALALDKNGELYNCDIMTYREIQTSWARSPKKNGYEPILANGELNPKSDHAKHPDRFCCRTVVHRLCKHIFNVTDDSSIVSVAFEDTEEDRSESEIVKSEIDHANIIPLDFDHENDDDVIEIESTPEKQEIVDNVDPVDSKTEETEEHENDILIDIDVKGDESKKTPWDN